VKQDHLGSVQYIGNLLLSSKIVTDTFKCQKNASYTSHSYSWCYCRILHYLEERQCNETKPSLVLSRLYRPVVFVFRYEWLERRYELLLQPYESLDPGPRFTFVLKRKARGTQIRKSHTKGTFCLRNHTKIAGGTVHAVVAVSAQRHLKPLSWGAWLQFSIMHSAPVHASLCHMPRCPALPPDPPALPLPLCSPPLTALPHSLSSFARMVRGHFAREAPPFERSGRVKRPLRTRDSPAWDRSLTYSRGFRKRGNASSMWG